MVGEYFVLRCNSIGGWCNIIFGFKMVMEKGNPKETFMEALGELFSDLIGWQLPIVFSGIKAWSLFIWIIGLVVVLLGLLFIIFRLF